MIPKIYTTDTPLEIARKIYYQFEVHNSCKVTGLVKVEGSDDPVAKGRIVAELIREFDRIENTTKAKDGRIRRRRKILDNTIGGYVADKIFRYSEFAGVDEVKWTFWRIQ